MSVTNVCWSVVDGMVLLWEDDSGWKSTEDNVAWNERRIKSLVMKGGVNGLKVGLDEWWTWMSALVWLCSANRERYAAYLFSVCGGKYLVVVGRISFVVVRGQYKLSRKAGNVWRGVRCAVGVSEGFCWSGGVLLMLASSRVFFMLLCHGFIIMMILLLFQWRADV